MRLPSLFKKCSIAVLVLLNAPFLASAAEDLHAGVETRCLCCHSCPNPTRDNTCLRGCERPPDVAEIPASMTGVPDIIQMDQMVGLYEPVAFPHKVHADMEAMGGGCAVCHHHNPPGRILACKECHGGPSNPANLSQPGLKGAYHRQCLGCHREWSHKTGCVICHAKRQSVEIGSATDTVDPTDTTASATVANGSDKTDITGMHHPTIETPEKWIYDTKEVEDGPMVTFHHKQHTELFGFKCVDCHKKESCNRCHDPQSHPPHIRQDPHEDCIKCHDVSDNCAHCHKKEEAKGFDHGDHTGFKLKAFHAELACVQCHKTAGLFKKLNRNCDGCHAADWVPEGFEHAKAGVELDETHKDADCKDCHTGGITKGVSCAGCHDDGRKFPESSPGKPLEVKPAQTH